jgi:lambda family phage tail tape measure protein
MQKQDELAIVVRVRDFATAALEKVKAVVGGIGGHIAGLSRNWMAYGLAASAAIMVAAKAWNVAEMGAKFAQQKHYLNDLAAAYGTTADSMVENIKRMSGGEIDTKTAVEVGASATSKGMKPEQLYQLARASETLADVTGENTAEAFRKYALQVVNAKKPTEELRQIMEQASAVQGVLGSSTDDVADKMARVRAQLEDAKLAMQVLVMRGGLLLLGLFQTAAAAALTLANALAAPVTAITAMTDVLGITEGKFEKMLAFQEQLGEAASYTWGQAKDSFSAMAYGLDETAIAAGRSKEALEKLFNKDKVKEHQKALEDSQEKIDQMYAQHGASRARTEGEFTRAKIVEFEAAHKVAFSDLAPEYRARFLEVVRDDWGKVLESLSQEQREWASEVARLAVAASAAEMAARAAEAEDTVRHEMALDEMRYDRYEILESELINRRAENEKRILSFRRAALADQSASTDGEDPEQVKILSEYRRIQGQIARIEELRAGQYNAAITRETREQLENARAIARETESLGMTGNRKAVHDMQSAYEDDVARHKEMVYRKQITWEEYDRWAVAREGRLAEDLKEIEGSYYDGAQRALEEYIDDARNLFAQGRDLFANMLGGWEDSLVRFVTTGKGKFHDFADSVIADLARIALRATITAPLANGLLGLFSGGGAAASSVSLSGGNYALSGLSNAGGSWFPPVTGMASGGPYQAGKTYMVGERGIELFKAGVSGTIVPNHALGGNTTINVNVPVTVSGDGASSGRRGSAGDAAETASALGQAIRRAVTDEILSQKRPGGLLYV